MDLRFNQLSGAIPSEVGSFPESIVLWLEGNELAGEIPTEIMNLTFGHLFLRLEQNCLTATDPALVAFLDDANPNWREGQCVELFDDYFESGDTNGWTAVMPPLPVP